MEILPCATAPVFNTSLTKVLEPVARDQNPAAVYLARLSHGSRRAMSAALEMLARIASGPGARAETFPWAALRYQHTQALRTALAARYAPSTANRQLSALRGALREAWRLGAMTAEDYRRAADLEPVRRERLPAGWEVTAGELRALFVACGEDATPAGTRDAALLAILYGGGLGRSEAVALDLADYTPESGELRVRAGKGGKERIVYPTNGARSALEAWLQIRGTECGALLRPVDKAGRVITRRITDQAVLYILRKRAVEAGVERFTPHDLRRTFISHLLDAGADLATVQRLAGHSNVTITARYEPKGRSCETASG